MRDPITNRAGPDSPKVPLSGPIQIYQHGILLSIRQKHVDGFWRQRNCSPGFYYLASSALPSMFAIWQAMHTCMIWYLASRVPMDGSRCGEQCSDPDRNHFCHIWLVGIFPNPYNRTSASCAIFSKRFKQVFWISWLSLKSIYTC